MLKKIKNYINPAWLFSILLLGVMLCILYEFEEGIRITAIIAFFIMGYRCYYNFSSETKILLIDKGRIDKKETILNGGISSFCLLGLFFLTKDNRVLIFFGLLLLFTAISHFIMYRFYKDA